MPSLRPSRYRWRKAIWIALVAALLALAPSAQADTKASRPQFGWLVRAFLQGPPPTTGVFVAAPSPTGSSVCATSTCCYVKDGGTATGTNGCFSAANFANADWGNAAKFYDQVSQAEAVITRGTGAGNVILVADGAYGEVTFDVAQSGTVPITILKATHSGDHGTATGWSSTFGDGQATWAVGTSGDFLDFTTNYWVMDGVIGDGSTTASGDDKTTYGFYLSQASVTDDTIMVRNDATNITFKHIAVQCAGGGFAQMAFAPFGDFTTYSYVYTSNCGGAVWNQADDVTVEYSYIGYNVYPSGTDHGNQLYAGDRFTARWNFIGGCNTQCVEPNGGCTTTASNLAFYGNIIENGDAGAAVISSTCDGGFINAIIANNTILRTGVVLLLQNHGGGAGGPDSGNIVENNLFWSGTNCCDQGESAGVITKRYNAYFASGQPYGESNEQNGGAGVPFAAGTPTSCTSGSNPPTTCPIGNYSLTSATTAGLTLGSPYNVDMFGAVRGADGTWDRGAIEKP